MTKNDSRNIVMNSNSKTKRQLQDEIQDLRNRLSEAQDALEAIRSGAIDALVVSDEQGERIFTLESVDYSYRVMVENMGEGAIILNKDGIVIFSNKAFAVLAQEEMPTLVGIRFEELLPESMHSDFFAFISRCMTETVREEFAIGSGETQIPVSISGMSFEAAGQANLCLIVNDLRERKSAEDKLKRQQEEIRIRNKRLEAQNEDLRITTETLSQTSDDLNLVNRDLMATRNRLSNLYEFAPVGYFTLDHTGVISEVNKTALEILKHDKKTMLGRHLKNFVADGFGMQYDDFLGKISAGREVTELKLTTSKGEIDAQLLGVPKSVKRDDLPDLYISLIDISGRKKTETALQNKMVELNRANEELQRFAYVASHDLQEPLRMVASFLQLLEQRYSGKLDDDANEFIGFAVNGAKRLQNMILSLLEYSRVNTRGNPMEPVSMEDVLADAIANVRLLIEENDARITHDRLPAVLGDRPQLSRVLSNLIANAIKFKSAERPHIHIGVEPKEGQWSFFVKDNGIGIDPQHHERVFVIFQRLHGYEYPGTGIGLSIAQRIIVRHGGEMCVDSEPGKGSIFYFSLPPLETEKPTEGQPEVKSTGEKQLAD